MVRPEGELGRALPCRYADMNSNLFGVHVRVVPVLGCGVGGCDAFNPRVK